MPRLSTVDKLPEAVRLEVGRLRQNGRTIDEILTHLKTMDGIAPVSRSALGRHLQGMEKLGERLRRSRAVAEGLVKTLGDAPESQAARLNIEMMHTLVLDLFMKAEGAGEDGEAAAVPDDPQSLMMMAKALDHLAKASKSNFDVIEQAEKRATAKAKLDAAATVEAIGREKGISAGTLDAIKAGIFGVKPDAKHA